ncbi:dihydroorotase [Peptoclostridium litorale DSM 5388]|uniref:Dihydroorotase n=1 Tax=Peptoclostridium litorale DSM 5388 TaxID=1121324 RepID=A0A069RGC1_PEPLI|nr:dihydroorotase [Peptoclostridium litorale]KDR96061.1 dihydroorotase PyrC [Peptoclostridium litorale DSM 5388]SIO05576.1 dihydroorotase [Peptoclostridium litorale DSM 5388]
MELLIKNARIVDHSNDFTGCIYIREGKIESISSDINVEGCEVLDAKGLIIMPSFVDLHAHFREPGLTYKEDIETGSRAAVRGGYTAVHLMANTRPACSDMDTVRYVSEKAKEIGLVDAYQCVSITKDMKGVDTSHIEEITEPVKCISDDGYGVMDGSIMIDAMVKAKRKGIIVMSHAEDHGFSKANSRLSENVMTWRDIEIARLTGAHLHLCHVSTKEAMDYIIHAKNIGVDVTCEVTPHHIFATNDIDYKVHPPLREEADVEFLIECIKNGYVDAIATDHAPHTAEDKENGSPGISGIETSFSICYTSLVKSGKIDLSKLSQIMSKNPADILGIKKGRISVGYDADFVLVDTDASYSIDPADFESKGKNTPFAGRIVSGEIIRTIKGGKTVYKK